MKALSYNRNAIWKFISIGNSIYSADEKGCLSQYDKIGILQNRLKCSDGWINGIDFFDSVIVLGTSKGEVIFVSKEMSIVKTIRLDIWINEIVIFRNEIYIATAEGLMVYINKRGDVRKKRISKYQLIDIVLVNNLLVAADTEGSIFTLSSDLGIVYSRQYPGFHITNMAYDGKCKKIYLTTLNGIIGCIGDDNNDAIRLQCYKPCNGRIWGISLVEETNVIGLVTSDNEMIVIDKDMNRCSKIANLDTLPTACLVKKKNYGSEMKLEK